MLLLDCGEGVDADVGVGLAGVEADGGEGGDVGGVGEVLCFEAEGGAEGVEGAALAFLCGVEEVAGVELDAGLGGVDGHDAAGLVVGDLGAPSCCQLRGLFCCFVAWLLRRSTVANLKKEVMGLSVGRFLLNRQ